jgi:prepilin-type N-terminal cleavage/methylation domain-containing protein
MKNRPGFSLMEIMVAVLLFSFAVTAFASLFPVSMRMRSKSENATRATMMAQQKIEQLRARPYADLNYTVLQGANLIDASSTTSGPYSFTQVDNLASQLPQATGTLTLTDVDPNNLKQADVTITWGGIVANGNSVTVSTQIANKEVYAP